MIYRIYDKVKKVFLDRNLYYVKQNGEIYRTSAPIPIKLQEQKRYEVRIVEVATDEGTKNGN